MWRWLVIAVLSASIGGCVSPRASVSMRDTAPPSPQAEQFYRHGLALLSAPQPQQDYAAANRDFERAAEDGHHKAQYFLGMAYLVGRGTHQNYPRARYWLERAAMSGDPNAQYHLGDIYLNGLGVDADPAWAAMWYGRSAQQGKAAAQFSLGVCYASGLGVAVELSRARAWLRLAARQDYPQARELEQALATRATGAVARVYLGEDGWMTPPVIRYVQSALKELGYRPGPVDGVWGRRTAVELARFLRLPGDEAEVTVTPEILDELRRASGTLPSPFLDRLRRWFD